MIVWSGLIALVLTRFPLYSRYLSLYYPLNDLTFDSTLRSTPPYSSLKLHSSSSLTRTSLSVISGTPG
jgi:hypothetical protein